MNIKPIHLKKSTLRKYKLSDVKALAGLLNNYQVSRWLSSVPFPYRLKDARSWVGKKIREYRQKEPANVVFALEVNGKLAGSIGLHKIVAGHKAEIGYWLSQKHWSRGIITEALAGVVQFGFENLKLHRLYAYVLAGNQGSRKVLERNGFVCEGCLRKNYKKQGRLYDGWLYAKVK